LIFSSFLFFIKKKKKKKGGKKKKKEKKHQRETPMPYFSLCSLDYLVWRHFGSMGG